MLDPHIPGAAPCRDLQDEARRRLPAADLINRVAVTATAPGRPEDHDRV